MPVCIRVRRERVVCLISGADPNRGVCIGDVWAVVHIISVYISTEPILHWIVPNCYRNIPRKFVILIVVIS